ncbi:MAG: membrane protein insertion efficiency factor YidD [Candidatus Obscuribacterales bacterium]|nr:membrane protein insertion efficiency factor YidD [Candidatus Obscuribacterales bacterium]
MKKALLSLLKLYQWTRPFRPASCRFYPSCSSYSYTAIETHGIFKGIVLTIGRLLRCHPLHCGGVDDVPERFEIALPISGIKRLLHVKR